jgi:hypothetical protein
MSPPSSCFFLRAGAFHRVFWAAAFLMSALPLANAQDVAHSAPRVLQSPDNGNFSGATKSLVGGPWELAQPWSAETQPGWQPGQVRFGWEPAALWVHAQLRDEVITTSSSADGESLWELGDVFEIFVGRRDSSDYAELHISPNNHRLTLQWPSGAVEKVRGGEVPLETFRRLPVGFQSWVRASPANDGWEVLVRIPADLIPAGAPLHEGESLDLSVSRYDCGSPGIKKILSSTSPHQARDFHRRAEWRRVVLDPPTGEARP